VKNLSQANLQSDYSTSSADLARSFLLPSLENATRYDRASGYFSSSLFVLAPSAWTTFFGSGGKMRLICSSQLTHADVDAVRTQGADAVSLREGFIDSWERMLKKKDGTLTAKFLSALIYYERLELRIARYAPGNGLFHDKLGIFYDSLGNQASFTGSANETWSAWSGAGNHESIDVFRSWEGSEVPRVRSHEKRFEDYWSGNAKGLEVFEGQDLRDIVVTREPDEDLASILEEVRKSLGAPGGGKNPNSQALKPLRGYQLEAVENWETKERGLISFATGGGKTLTAIEIIRRWNLRSGSAIVLVPTSILVEQWIKELRENMPEARILRADSTEARNWPKTIGSFLAADASGPSRIVVTTYKTAASKRFKSLVQGNDELLVIGDEVHRFGANDTRTIAQSLSARGRLGLSATPLRKYDDEGTDAIFEYFGQHIEPTYTLSQAIKDGNLVPYNFEFLSASLSTEEQEEWDDLTARIGKLLGSDGLQGNGRRSSAVEALSVSRARVAKLAQSKTRIAAEVVAKNFEEGDRWLVYCETVEHVSSVMEEIRSRMPRVTLMKYLSSNSSDHRDVMNHFEQVGGILVAIRCLDEGVDIPLINKAVIVSSSQSEREFIQRRGRALRRAPGKNFAYLFDFLMETSDGEILNTKELERLLEFSRDAFNQEPYIRLMYMKEAALH